VVKLVVAAPLPLVPDVVGRQVSAAVKATEKAGFEVKTKKQNTTTDKNGLVLSQTPSPGTEAKPGTIVSIVYANNTCTPGYSPCLPVASDYDCAGGTGNGPKYVSGTVKVTGTDQDDLDSDGDGIGCN
jgi:beta-lactam-binding protein with PASTA domain